MLISLPAHTLPNLIMFTVLTNVLPTLNTFTLTMGSTVFLVIMVPRVRTELANQGSRWVQGVSQNDFTKCNTGIMASNHFPMVFLREYDACS